MNHQPATVPNDVVIDGIKYAEHWQPYHALPLPSQSTSSSFASPLVLPENRLEPRTRPGQAPTPGSLRPKRRSVMKVRPPPGGPMAETMTTSMMLNLIGSAQLGSACGGAPVRCTEKGTRFSLTAGGLRASDSGAVVESGRSEALEDCRSGPCSAHLPGFSHVCPLRKTAYESNSQHGRSGEV